MFKYKIKYYNHYLNHKYDIAYLIEKPKKNFYIKARLYNGDLYYKHFIKKIKIRKI